MIDTFRVHSGNVMISQVQFVLVMYVYSTSIGVFGCSSK